MNQLLLILSVLLLFTACSDEKPAPELNIMEVREIGELSTTEYTIGKIVKLDNTSAEWYKWGDRKILISCKAIVKGGVDLSEIKEGDIKVEGNTIVLRMPPAKITTFSMDPKFIQTEMESVSGFRDNFTQEEKYNFLKQGEQAIKDELKNLPILDDAEKNAAKILEKLFKQMGYKKVIIHKTKAE